MKDTLRFYFPGKNFPSVSITGKHCALGCKHCMGHYLEGMIPIKGPDELYRLAMKLEIDEKKGFLLSGGCTLDGRVPLEGFYKTIKKIKSETSLIINAHTGLVNERDAEELFSTGIDVVSVDVVGSKDTIQRVYGLERDVMDYQETLFTLDNAGLVVVPHVCAGLHFGKLKGEFFALEMIKKIRARGVIITSLVPTKNTLVENIHIPQSLVIKVVERAKKDLPHVPIILGCMRSRKNRDLEARAIMTGVDGVALPSRGTIKWALREGYDIDRIDGCCAIVGLGQ